VAQPPAFAGSADRVATLLLAMETAPAVTFSITPTARLEGAAMQAIVVVRLAGAVHLLSPEEARLTARCICFEDERRATGLLVSLFQSAACDAEALASGRCPDGLAPLLQGRPLNADALAALLSGTPIEQRAVSLAHPSADAPATAGRRGRA